jgi:hypothetical protein
LRWSGAGRHFSPWRPGGHVLSRSAAGEPSTARAWFKCGWTLIQPIRRCVPAFGSHPVLFRLLDEPLGDGIDPADTRWRVSGLARNIPANNGAEIPVRNLNAATISPEGYRAAQDVERNDFALTRWRAAALADLWQRLAHLLVAFLFVRKATEEATAKAADLLWV